MRHRHALHLILSLVFPISTTLAAPPIRLPTSAPFTPSIGLVRPVPDKVNTTRQVPLPPTSFHSICTNSHSSSFSFPPGPPPSSIDYQIPGSDLTLELSSLGFIPGRNEAVVRTVLNDAFRASLIPFRPHQSMDEAGYKISEGGFVLGMSPSSAASRLPSQKPLTWGMWTESLVGLNGYVEAYPGYDFTFDIRFAPPVGPSVGYVIGSGVAFTRGIVNT